MIPAMLFSNEALKATDENKKEKNRTELVRSPAEENESDNRVKVNFEKIIFNQIAKPLFSLVSNSLVL